MQTRIRQAGFTLVELMVVIAIIGVLSAALMASFGRASEGPKATRCKANLRNLAQAAQSYMVSNDGRLPWAGSYEFTSPATDLDAFPKGTAYHERPGWVAWTGNGGWPNEESQSSGMKPACFCGSSKDVARLSITKGSLWSYSGKNLDSYLCDAHKGAAKRAKLSNVMRSYVMNGYFGYNRLASEESGGQPPYREVFFDGLSNRGIAANLLLFAELPAYKLRDGKFEEDVEGSGRAANGVLETDVKGYGYNEKLSDMKLTGEIIGFNHKISGNRFVAHVAFVDGHVGVVAAPEAGSELKEANLKSLTYLLCNGADVPGDPKKWDDSWKSFWDGK